MSQRIAKAVAQRLAQDNPEWGWRKDHVPGEQTTPDFAGYTNQFPRWNAPLPRLSQEGSYSWFSGGKLLGCSGDGALRRYKQTHRFHYAGSMVIFLLGGKDSLFVRYTSGDGPGGLPAGAAAIVKRVEDGENFNHAVMYADPGGVFEALSDEYEAKVKAYETQLSAEYVEKLRGHQG